MINLENQFNEHVNEAVNVENNVVYVALQGSQNYGLAYENSDVDTKAIVMPSFNDIVLNSKAKSYTHVRNNNEHIDFKDIRLMFECWKKQNINFVEILFSDYFAVNPEYAEIFYDIRQNAESIAVLNPYRALKCMKGMTYEKHAALTHRYPSKADIIDKYGYDGKQLHHMIRLNYFISYYVSMIMGDSNITYKDILSGCFMRDEEKERLKRIKQNKEFELDEAINHADAILDTNIQLCDNAIIYLNLKDENNKNTEKYMDYMLTKFVKLHLKKEVLK